MNALNEIIQEINQRIEAYKGEDDLLGVADVIAGLREARAIVKGKTMRARDWIPAGEPPKYGEYVLLSFANFSLPLVGRFDADENGDGAYYVGDCDEQDTCISQDLIVDAWMPLPKPYREHEDENREETVK